MVVFFCAFLALRYEDDKTPCEEIMDFEIHKETELFAGSVSATLPSNKGLISRQIHRRRSL